jgi:protein tyrosine phosphatase (PTP) superfamily phosphohydrolase (DUF442 family)
MSYITNYYTINEKLACSGQPKEDQLKSLADEGFKTVVNLGLKDKDYSLPDEQGAVTQYGMNYYHIPVVFNKPNITQLDEFIRIMRQNWQKKILVHCAMNYRATCFTGLYLFAEKQLTEEAMTDLIQDVWQPDEIWQSFIEDSIKHISEPSK